MKPFSKWTVEEVEDTFQIVKQFDTSNDPSGQLLTAMVTSQKLNNNNNLWSVCDGTPLVLCDLRRP